MSGQAARQTKGRPGGREDGLTDPILQDPFCCRQGSKNDTVLERVEEEP